MSDNEQAMPSLDDAGIRRLATVDLNLLVVFSALMQDRSVTLAAARLFVGQSAVSASLKRLRALFKDPLFVKAGRGLTATPRSVALHPLVERILGQIDGLTFGMPSFDPGSARTVVRVGMSDDNEILFLPTLVRELQRVAPQVRLVARAVSHQDIRSALDQGDVDVGLSVFGELSSWHCHELAYEHGYGFLYDPRIRRRSSAWSLDELLETSQIIVTFDGTLEGKVDRILAERGLRRDVRYGTTRFASLPYLIQGTPLVASLPELVGRVLARSHALAFSPLPFEVPPSRPRLAWHRCQDNDPANRWLRGLIKACVGEVVESLRAQDPPDRAAGHAEDVPG